MIHQQLIYLINVILPPRPAAIAPASNIVVPFEINPILFYPNNCIVPESMLPETNLNFTSSIAEAVFI